MVGCIERDVTLDLNRHGVQERISARQGDSMIYNIRIKLICDGMTFSPKGVALAQVYAVLPDGSIVSADCKEHRGGYTFIPTAGFFKLGGPVVCRLVLRGDDGGELYSSAFAFDAEPCFGDDGKAYPAEEYSRLEELLLRVLDTKRECEEIAAKLGKITTQKSTIAVRDSFIVYSASEGDYVRINWESVGNAMQKRLDNRLIAVGVTDTAGSGYVASVPELEDDCEIALRSDIPKSPKDIGAQPAGSYVTTDKKITVVGVDENGVTHTWTMYGVKA